MMSISRSMPRRGWTLLTAILATVAVIAALLTVPWGKAGAAESKPTDFVPNNTLGKEDVKTIKDPSHNPQDTDWGVLVWAGEPSSYNHYVTATNKNDVGWAWCLEPLFHTPLQTSDPYQKATATRLEFDNQYHDAVINLARKMESAAKKGDAKSAAKAANYYVYLLAFLDLEPQNQTAVNTKKAVIGTIRGNEDQFQVVNETGERQKVFSKFSGSLKEFTELTGYRIEGEADGGNGPWGGKPLTFVPDQSVKIETQPADAYITVVHPNNNPRSKAQTVMPVDQPGLPDENGGSGSNPSEKKNAIVSTNADFENGAHEVVAGAKIVDQVSYEGLVPGKEYTLDAQLISKEDGKTVLGETKGHTFKPEAADGTEAVTITVNDDVTEPVEAAVAFETLTSKVVNDKGEDTPDNDKPNKIGEHKDIDDDDQTVPKKNPEPSESVSSSKNPEPSESVSSSKNPEPGKTTEAGKPSDTPDGSNDDDDDDNGSSKSDWPWWLLLIPGLGIVKIIADGFGGGHDGGHNVSDGGHEGGNDHGDVTEDNDRGTNVKDESVKDTGRGDRDDSALDATAPEDAGQPLPSNAERVEIKHVPSGATKLEPGMQSYIK